MGKELPKKEKRKKLRIGVAEGKPQRCGRNIITVRRRRGQKYSVEIFIDDEDAVDKSESPDQ